MLNIFRTSQNNYKVMFCCLHIIMPLFATIQFIMDLCTVKNWRKHKNSLNINNYLIRKNTAVDKKRTLLPNKQFSMHLVYYCLFLIMSRLHVWLRTRKTTYYLFLKKKSNTVHISDFLRKQKPVQKLFFKTQKKSNDQNRQLNSTTKALKYIPDICDTSPFYVTNST